MAELYGTHFEFNGKSSREYGLIFANVDTSRFTRLAGESKSSFIYNQKSNRRYIMGTDYSEAQLSIELEIVQEDGLPFPLAVRREIERWLFSPTRFGKLYFDMADDCDGAMYEVIEGETKRLYLNCHFIDPERLEYNGGVVGYKATLEADSNMLWQDSIFLTFTKPPNHIDPAAGTASSDEDEGYNSGEGQASSDPHWWQTPIITVDSDYDGFIYPTVKLVSAGATARLCNVDEPERETRLQGITVGDTYVLYGEINRITRIPSGASDEEPVSGDIDPFTNRARRFLRLSPGDNILACYYTISMISVEFSNRRFL